MNLYFRVLWVFLQHLSGLKQKKDPLAVYHLNLYTFPNDLDVNLHVNNGRYLTLMDLGRFQLMLCTGLWSNVLKHRWAPMIGACKVHFLKSLKAFQRFTLTTQVVYWNDKWIFIEQKILRNGELIVTGMVKGLFVGKDGHIPSETLMKALNHQGPAPEMPPLVKHWIEAEGKRDEE